MRRLWLKVVMLALVLFASAQPASAEEKRVALVIGDADYRNIFKLKNPVNDATDIGAALSRMGFSVTVLQDATAEQTRRALSAFGEKARQADYAVVFYAGHAVQAHGVNWLIPVDGSADTLLDVANHSITLDDIVAQLAGTERLAVVLLDAARNNPFPASKAPSVRETPQAAPKNLILGYATGAGQKVSDGEGRHSPFTAALLKNIETPGLDVSDLVKRVRDDVVKATAAKQIPFFQMSIPDEPISLAPRP